MPERIGILDLAMGNLLSVANAFAHNGLESEIVDSAARFDDFSHLVIPGVGHFAHAMARVDAAGLRRPICEFADSGRPLLGLCVGMQILAHRGTEGRAVDGLGLIRGEVRRLPERPSLPVPHVGWNELSIRRSHPVFDGLKSGRDMYFVHSFALDAVDPDEVLAVTDYGGPVVAAVGRGNILGFQFHPEKSQLNGLKLIENFGHWDGRC
jgi:glutamine amidotransferase